jgi:hypothetical protein
MCGLLKADMCLGAMCRFNLQGQRTNSASYLPHAAGLFNLFSDPEDEGNLFIRNID